MLGGLAALAFAGKKPAGHASPPPEPRKQRSGKLAFLLFLAGALAVVALAIWVSGWDRVLADRQNPETEDAYADGDYTPLSARVQGYVARMLVNDNQQVRAGDVLMEIEDDNYRAQVRQAEAAVTAQEAALQALGAREAAMREQVAEAGSQTEAMRAQRVYAAQEATRQHMILPTDLGLLRTTQQADQQSRVTAATLRQMDSLTRERQRQLDLVAAQEERARAQVGVLKAQAELARINLGYTRIRAPRDGVVGVRQVRVGDLVRPGQQVIPIVPLGNVWVTANFNERQLTHIRVGQVAKLRFDAYPNTELNGHVVGLSPLTGQLLTLVPPDNTTGNYTKVVQRVPVKITLDNQADSPVYGLIRPGLSVLARVQTDGPASVRTAR